MRIGVQTYEVKVEVIKRGSMHFSSHVGRYIESKITKTFHIESNKQDGAKRKAEKHGRVISCRKVSASDIMERMAVITESQPLGLQMTNPYPDAIAMDDFIWKKKNNRAERIRNNRERDNGH